MTTDPLLAPALAGRPYEDVYIADMHAHIGPWDRSHMGTLPAAEMAHTMDLLGVRVACISDMRALFAGGKDLGNDNAFAAAQAFPGRFLPYIVVKAEFACMMERELERCLARGKVAGIKLYGAYDSPHIRPAFEFANAHSLNMLCHGIGPPELTRTLAEEYPEARIIIAHLGMWDGIQPNPHVELVRTHDNLYSDLSASMAPFGGLTRLVERVGSHKVLLGTDFPLHDASFEVGRVLFAQLPEQDRRNILGLNLARLLDLPVDVAL